MPDIPSRMGLHLMYRLWIAELNHDINLLRIFDDYLLEAKTKSVEAGISEKIDAFKKSFAELRTEIDELRHSMHLVKMKLASEARQQEVFRNCLKIRKNILSSKKITRPSCFLSKK